MARVKRGVTAHAKHKKVLKKAKGYYGGDWPEEMIGQPKQGPSGYYDENGDITTCGEVVMLNSLEDLKSRD